MSTYSNENWNRKKLRVRDWLIFLATIVIIILGCLAVLSDNREDTSYDVEISQIEANFEPESDIGVASYYDYCLDSGWCSIGHRVCATRHQEWRYKMIKVTNLENGEWVICKQTDHGPDKNLHPDRIVDLSSYAFSLISDTKLGLFNAKIELVE
jgi:hypothetical protein